MRKDAPLAVDVPSPDRDSPGWIKVGVIAVIGFVIGIAWPRLMGVKFGPSAPGESGAASAKASAARASEASSLGGSVTDAGRASAASPVAHTGSKPGASAEPAISATAPTSASAGGTGAAAGPPQIHVQKGSVLSCKTTEGESKKGKECGAVGGLDLVVAPRLRKVASCSAAEGQTGKLSFMVTADFSGGRLNWDIGKSSTVGNLDGITSCLKTHFQGVGTNGVAHEHARYTVAYTATFAPSSEPASTKEKTDAPGASDEGKGSPGDRSGAGGAGEAAEATVGWEVALVRDVPKTGGIVARLPRGTKVKLGTSKDGWYAVKYGDGFAGEGWVYRGAVGR